MAQSGYLGGKCIVTDIHLGDYKDTVAIDKQNLLTLKQVGLRNCVSPDDAF